MVHRVEIKSIVPDTRADTREFKLSNEFNKPINAEIVDVYTVDSDITLSQLQKSARMLVNPVTQKAFLDESYFPKKSFDWAIEIGFLPGVKDNVASTAREGIEDLLKAKFSNGQ